MNSDRTSRDKIITNWYVQEWIGDATHVPGPEDVVIFMKILLDILAVNGKLSDFERNYVVGRAAILGVPEEMLKTLQLYQPNSSEDFQHLDLPHVRKTRMGLLHNLFRVFSVDHKIHPKDMKVIYKVGKKLDVSDVQIQQIQNLHEEEEKLRQKRALLLFPYGFQDALIEYQKLHS